MSGENSDEVVLTRAQGRWRYIVSFDRKDFVRGTARATQRNQTTGCQRRVRRRPLPLSDDAERDRNVTHINSSARSSRPVQHPSPNASDNGSLYLHVQTQEKDNQGKYQVFHQARITADADGLVPAANVRSVAYHTPNQGFRNDSRERYAAPYEIRYGPCWGRPHVTIDITLNTSEVLQAVFEDNLPRTDTSFLLYDPRNVVRSLPSSGLLGSAPELAAVQPPVHANATTNASTVKLPPLGHSLEPNHVQEHLICSISTQVFQDPVICMDGHTYDRHCIEEWFLDHNTSPMTNLELCNKMLVPNLALRQELDALSRQLALH